VRDNVAKVMVSRARTSIQ